MNSLECRRTLPLLQEAVSNPPVHRSDSYLSKYKPGKTDASRKNLRQKIKPNTNRKIQENSVRFCRNNLKNQQQEASGGHPA